MNVCQGWGAPGLQAGYSPTIRLYRCLEKTTLWLRRALIFNMNTSTTQESAETLDGGDGPEWRSPSHTQKPGFLTLLLAQWR